MTPSSMLFRPSPKSSMDKFKFFARLVASTWAPPALTLLPLICKYCNTKLSFSPMLSASIPSSPTQLLPIFNSCSEEFLSKHAPRARVPSSPILLHSRFK
eukprot:Lithocolla_globosa_v1_NODE_120_length_6112_cov_229.957240.p4 type:complete len:100 gc:universal NODE_120_length_6112_cov_229.957240:3079-2780(-)